MDRDGSVLPVWQVSAWTWKPKNEKRTTITTRVLVAGGVCILLCCPVSKRLQKRRPKNLGFGNKLKSIVVYLKSARRRREQI